MNERAGQILQIVLVLFSVRALAACVFVSFAALVYYWFLSDESRTVLRIVARAHADNANKSVYVCVRCSCTSRLECACERDNRSHTHTCSARLSAQSVFCAPPPKNPQCAHDLCELGLENIYFLAPKPIIARVASGAGCERLRD